MRIKGMSEREILFLLVAVFVGRVHILGVNPFVIGFFMAVCFERIPKKWFGLACILGVWSGFGWYDAIKYGCVIALAGTSLYALEKWRIQGSLLFYSVLGAVSLLSVEYVWYRLQSRTLQQEQMAVMLLETLLTAVITQILYIGIHFLLNGKRTAYANNEEMLSMIVLGSLLAFGMPFQRNSIFSLEICVLSFLLLFVGYRYGAGAGSLTGAISGLFYIGTEEKITMLGILVLLGVGVGAFRELGRLVSTATFVAIFFICGVYFEGDLLLMGSVRAVGVSALLFLVLPRRYSQKVEPFGLEGEYAGATRTQMEQQIKRRLERFSEPFFSLARTFEKMAKGPVQMQEQDMKYALQQVGDTLCAGCEKENRCLGFTRHEKYGTAGAILCAARENGWLREEDFPMDFSKKCDYLPEYVYQTNQTIRLLHNNLIWKNKLAESRGAIAEQLRDVGFLFRELAREIGSEETFDLQKERELRTVLKRNQILVKKIEKMENNRHIQEIRIWAKSKPQVCVTTRELAKCVSQILGKEYVSAPMNRNVLGKSYESILLVEKPVFRGITGVARCTKEGEELCGDNYSFLNLDSGELVMCLSDGMGSGADACVESTSVVELMENFLEAGVGERTALHLINSVLLLQGEEQKLSTLDMVVINLYTGLCDFVKMGASTAFIKRNNGVETISSNTLPLGVFEAVEYQDVSRKLYQGDFIILMSDGVLDTAPVEDKEAYFVECIEAMDSQNANELANRILELAMVNSGGRIEDDMTVLVTGVW